MFQESELINLFISIVSLFILLPFIIKQESPGLKTFLLAFLFVLCSQIFTVIEGFYLPNVFNILEHLTYVIAGCIFAFACRKGEYLYSTGKTESETH